MSTIDDASAQRLRAAALAWLTTVRADGQPQTSYVWFHFDGHDIVLLSRPDAAKIRNITANPRVSLHLDGNVETGGDVLVLEARADLTGDLAPERWAAYAEKYAGRIGRGSWGTPEGFRADFSMAIRLTPGRTRAW